MAKALQVSDLPRVVWSGGQQVLMWLLSEHAGLMIGTLLVMMARFLMSWVLIPGLKLGKAELMLVEHLLHRMMVVQQQPLAMMKPQEL